MLTRSGRVVVMDFGLARGETGGGGAVAGTPAELTDSLEDHVLQLTAPDQELGLDFLYGLAGLTYAASLLYIGLLRLLRGRWGLQAFIQFFGDLLLITGLVIFIWQNVRVARRERSSA